MYNVKDEPTSFVEYIWTRMYAFLNVAINANVISIIFSRVVITLQNNRLSGCVVLVPVCYHQ